MSRERNTACHCPRVTHYHGTQLNYLTHACRCQPCTNDATRARDRLRRIDAYGRDRTRKTPAHETRNHINNLIQQGMTIAGIARTAGVSHQTIRIIIGTGTQPVSTIYNSTATAVLAVTPTTPQHTGLINATGTQRRIQALAAIGYPLEQQARLAGLQPDKPRHILTQQRIRASTAEAIKQLFNRLQLTPNPTHNAAATQARNTARKHGWLPPLAWDEDGIDDPTHEGYRNEVAA